MADHESITHKYIIHFLNKSVGDGLNLENNNNYSE